MKIICRSSSVEDCSGVILALRIILIVSPLSLPDNLWPNAIGDMRK